MFRTSKVAMLLPSRKGRVVPGRVRSIAAVNLLPHPRWLDARPNALTEANAGWVVWVVGVLVARLLGIEGSRRALRQVPASIAAASLAQYPLKRLLHRPRPVSATIRSLVLRQRGRGRTSLPSGHTAVAFAGAWAAGTVWPRWAPAFLALASAIGANRVHLGTHHASDAATGAVVGVVVADIVRRVTRRILA